MNPRNNKKCLDNFILDLDGVLTDGSFHYSIDGKVYKTFGPDDHDALKFLGRYLNIRVITADTLGFEISKKRVQEDMKLCLDLVSAEERVGWIARNFDQSKTAYMGDGILDPLVFSKVKYSIAPANALQTTKDRADFVTKSTGGNRAVAEACMHILVKFFNIKISDFLNSYTKN